MEAFAGHDHLRHYRDRDVSSNTWAVNADASGALSIALAAQMALYARERTGRGQYVDVSMVENFIQMIGQHVLEFSYNHRVPESLGNRHRSAIQGCYPCAGDDRWLVLTLPTDGAWRRFVRATGNVAAFAAPEFTTVASRYANHDAVDQAISGWTNALDRDQAVDRLRAEGLMAGPVLDDADAIEDEHLAARGFFVEIPHQDAGTHRYPGFPYRFSEAELRVRLPPVRLGEHNEYVYKKLLGICDEEYEELSREGHIGDEYSPDVP
jgi:crotonobetainyl-CoA:carnitine CoA-transferase CaiB-like acyl-CoA transferase